MRSRALLSFFFLVLSVSLSAASPVDKKEKPEPPGRNEQLCLLSEKLGIPIDLYSPHLSLYLSVSDWLGTPYRYGWMSKKGTDCSGFTLRIFQEVFSTDIYRTSGSLFASSRRIAKDSLEVGDLLFFKTRGRSVSHVGIYLGNDRFAHAASGTGVKISDLNHSYYKNRYAGAGRIETVFEPKPLYFDASFLSTAEPVFLAADLISSNNLFEEEVSSSDELPENFQKLNFSADVFKSINNPFSSPN